MIANPNRINLGRVAIQIDDMELSEDELLGKSQYTDLYSGVIYSTFSYSGQQVNVQTTCAPDSDTIGIQIQSQLIDQRRLTVFFDYPYASGADKFDDRTSPTFLSIVTNVVQHSLAYGMPRRIIPRSSP